MARTDGDHWDKARLELIARWREILERIDDRDARDDGGALTLANVMDEFCEEASSERQSALYGSERPIEPAPVVPAANLDDPAETHETYDPSGPAGRCRFCRGFISYGGCFGTLDRFNRTVSDGRWDEARRIGEEYIALLESMAFEKSAPRPARTGRPNQTSTAR